MDIFEKLIAFEDKYSEDLMAWSHNGIHFWPCIRTSVFVSIEQKYLCNLNNNSYNESSKRLKLLSEIIKNSTKLSKNPYIHMPKAKIVYLNSAITRVLEVNMKKFDRISDYFADESKNSSLTMEDNYLGRHNTPEYTSSIKYTDSVFLIAKLKQRFIKNKILFNDIAVFIDSLKQKLIEQFENSINVESVISNAFRSIITSVAMAMEMHKLIIKTGCKFVSIEDCCYGGYKSILAMLLKMDGIKVIEIQHGLVSKKHIAYNFGRTPEIYLKYLPDYFFTYGEYWSEVLIRLPVKKVVVGSPYLAEQVKVYNESNGRQSKGKRVLVVSQTTATDKFVAITKELRRLITADYSITFRLHPSEVQFRAERCSGIENVLGIEINQEGGIYDCISKHDFIVGESSTTLFEAIPFKKTIFIMDTYDSRAHMPINIGFWFNSVEDLTNMILSNYKNENIDPSYYWTLSWQKNFNNFFQTKI